MIKKFYHGAMLEDANKIIECGYINAGCICDNKKRASVYARGDGYVFTVYQKWSVFAILRLSVNRFLLSLFSDSETWLLWLYDIGVFPTDCEMYITEPWAKLGMERRFKIQEYERILTTSLI